MGLSDKEQERRLREFLTADVQFNPDWTAFLIQQAKQARDDHGPGWEGSANANFVTIGKDLIRIEPLFNQYPEPLELENEAFIDLLQAWMDRQSAARVSRKQRSVEQKKKSEKKPKSEKED